MSAYEAQRPVFRLLCDHEECSAWFEAGSGFDRRFAHATRNAARDAGWDVPPIRGTGSRRDTDFCPEHAGGAS